MFIEMSKPGGLIHDLEPCPTWRSKSKLERQKNLWSAMGLRIKNPNNQNELTHSVLHSYEFFI